MDRRHGLRTLAALAGGSLAPSRRAAAAAPADDDPPARTLCSALSPIARVTLVELYTSEGCSSCPPADRWLSRVAARDTRRIAALSLHVKYWDHIGWPDPYAQAAFAERQRWLTAVGGGRTVYTPGIFVDGREWRRYDDDAALARRLDAATRTPAAAGIALTAALGADGTATLSAVATRRDAAAPFARPALFVALTESGLSSRVTAGENRGETLQHDHVVRRFAGPGPFDAGGRARLSLPFDAADGARRGLVAVAFVQDLGGGAPLQAMSMPLGSACARS